LVDRDLEGVQMIRSDSVSQQLLAHALAMVIPMVTALVLTTGVAYAADPPASTPAADEPPSEEVIVEGKHEGPRMWRIAKGDHVLWVLGTISPLPRKMTWQSDSVATVLQETQEVLPAWPSIGVGANPFTALRLYFTWRKIQKSPDHMKLQEQLPPDLYARFSALKARYAPRDKKL
jgi:hypothetical protein